MKFDFNYYYRQRIFDPSGTLTVFDWSKIRRGWVDKARILTKEEFIKVLQDSL